LHDPTLDDFSRQEAAELIPKSNPFLRRLFQYIAGYDIDERIKSIVDNLADVFRATDVDALLHNFGKSTQTQDPIIHFYETFLAEYDPKLRKSRGVWYTPEPVVNFIVRAVDDILKTEFNLSKGLADTSKIKIKVETDIIDKRKGEYKKEEKEVHKVQILDPAAGTGTFLAEVVRQSENSGILHNATEIRKLLVKKSFEIPSVKLENFTDIIRLHGEDLVEELSSSYDREGLENSIVVVRSNKMANRYNQGIRNTILWREEEVSTGDFFMVVKNNYFWLQENESVGFIANGDIIEILRINGYQERYGFRFADMVLKLKDYGDIEFEAKVLLDTIHVEAASMSSEENKKLFYSVLEDYSKESSK